MAGILLITVGRKLTVDLAKDYDACAIIRGLRAVSDFEYEFQLATYGNDMSKVKKGLFNLEQK